MCKIFGTYNLKITFDVNHKRVDFLDVNFDLDTELYKPFLKPNDTPQYVNRKSNHPPTITKNIPLSVNRRLSTISSNERVFEAAASPYQEALKQSGYEYKLHFEKDATSRSSRKNRKRNITWFNPPYSANVSTPLGAKFLKIIDTCFPPTNPLRKILNRSTVKVSYRCMPNMGQMLAKHNACNA